MPDLIVYVNSTGGSWFGPPLSAALEALSEAFAVRGRLASERARYRSLLARATPPARVSPEIIAAPARFYSIAETPRETVMTDNGPRIVRSAPQGFDRVRIGDAFDRMDDAARKAHVQVNRRREKAGRDPVPYVPVISVGQQEIGREYARLVERCEAAGVKCSSIETVGGGSGDPDAREAAIISDLQRVRLLRRRIGDGLAREIRRHRPSETGGQRTAIRIRTLVDDVCLSGLTLDQVFKRYGWAKANGKMHAELRDALCGALDRMRGFDLARAQHAA